MRALYRARVQNQPHTKGMRPSIQSSQTSQSAVDGSHGARPIPSLSGAAKVADPEEAGSPLEFFKEGHSGLGALQSELFNGIVLAAGAAPV